MEKIFHTCASKRLAELHRRAREADKQPPWIGDDIWDDLRRYWGSEKYLKRATTNKKNRHSEKGGSLHTGGSINTAQHKLRMVS